MLFKYSLLLVLVLSCGHHPHGTNASNQHMHKKSHDDLIKAFDDPSRDEWQKPQVVLHLMGNLKDKALIDIGAGSGYFSKFFLAAGARLVAADVDRKFLHHIEKNLPQASRRLIPFDDPLMKEGEFDFAFTCNTYHHIDERVAYLKKVRLGLKTGGQFVVVDFKAQSDVTGPPLKMRIPVAQAIKEFELAGFSKVHVYESELPRQYVLIGVR